MMNRFRVPPRWMLTLFVMTTGMGALQKFLHTANAIGGGGRAFG
jgi:hypothetical protein